MLKLNLLALLTIFISSTAWAAQAHAYNMSDPVCALKSDGTRATYPNARAADDDKAKILHLGSCLGRACAMGGVYWITVCAISPTGKKQTYNLCAAENANAVMVSRGPCP